MPYAGSDFDVVDTNEVLPLFFDFSPMLVSGEFPISATWTAAVAGSSTVYDASAASIVNGAATISGNVTGQSFHNVVNGCKYRVDAAVVTNLGNTLNTYSYFTGNQPG